MTKSLENKLNCGYTSLLRAALNVHWSQRVSNKDLYNNLPKITESIHYRWLKFSGHIWRHDEKCAQIAFLDANKWKKQKRKVTENLY